MGLHSKNEKHHRGGRPTTPTWRINNATPVPNITAMVISSWFRPFPKENRAFAEGFRSAGSRERRTRFPFVAK
jgi:hypothetical protein